MSKTYSAGVVTAYGAALQGGYNGTYAQFVASLGALADTLTDFQNFSVEVTELSGGSEATASYENGVLSLGIPKGAKGDKGDAFTYADFTPQQLESLKGDDGVSPVVSIAAITGGNAVTFTDATHPSGQTFNVMDGSDYVLTAQDKSDIADLVLAQIPYAEGVGF